MDKQMRNMLLFGGATIALAAVFAMCQIPKASEYTASNAVPSGGTFMSPVGIAPNIAYPAFTIPPRTPIQIPAIPPINVDSRCGCRECADEGISGTQMAVVNSNAFAPPQAVPEFQLTAAEQMAVDTGGARLVPDRASSRGFYVARTSPGFIAGYGTHNNVSVIYNGAVPLLPFIGNGEHVPAANVGRSYSSRYVKEGLH